MIIFQIVRHIFSKEIIKILSKAKLATLCTPIDHDHCSTIDLATMIQNMCIIQLHIVYTSASSHHTKFHKQSENKAEESVGEHGAQYQHNGLLDSGFSLVQSQNQQRLRYRLQAAQKYRAVQHYQKLCLIIKLPQLQELLLMKSLLHKFLLLHTLI